MLSTPDIPRSAILDRIRGEYTKRDVDNDVAAIDAVIATLQGDRKTLLAIRPILPPGNPPLPPLAEIATEAEEAEESEEAEEETDTRPKRRPRGATRDAIFAVMWAEADFEAWWRPPTVRRRLHERGIDISTNLVGTTMRRMADDGVVRWREADGAREYALPVDNNQGSP